MATVIFDIDDSGNQTTLDDDGYHVTRIVIVTDITPSGNDSVVYDAITDAGMPAIGDAHPTISTIKLKEINGRAISQTKAKLSLAYSRDDNDTTTKSESVARISASTSTEDVNTDKNGDAMETVYSVANSLASWTEYNEQFTAEVERPRLNFEFGYKTSLHPISDINAYLGKVNSTVWNGYAANTILCSNITVDQEGGDYSVNFSFVYNADTWIFEGKISEPRENLTVSTDVDLDLATGIKTFEVYESTDFSPLGFRFVNQIVSGLPDSLVITEYAASIALDIDIDTGTPDALVITEQVATIT